MLNKKTACALLTVFVVIEVIYLTYYFTDRLQMNNFNCAATLVQHYKDDSYLVSINYVVRGDFGLVHINGYSDINPKKIFNRKVSFKIERNGDLFYVMSEKNIKLPDDNFNEGELSQVVPRFFVAPGNDIYMRIKREKNNNLVFMVDSIPTYVCNTTTGGS